jgi:putative tricarboxylic transport membrane protein
MKIGHPKNFWGGMMFTAFGLLFAVVAIGVKIGDHALLNGYAMGTPARMGPGFFPFWLGVILIVLGLVISITALRGHGGVEAKLERFHWGPLAYVLFSIVLFGVLLQPTGMLFSGVVLIIGASLGSPSFRLKPVLLLAVFLVVFCALVFVILLKLPIPLCPNLEFLQQYRICRA